MEARRGNGLLKAAYSKCESQHGEAGSQIRVLLTGEPSLQYHFYQFHRMAFSCHVSCGISWVWLLKPVSGDSQPSITPDPDNLMPSDFCGAFKRTVRACTNTQINTYFFKKQKQVRASKMDPWVKHLPLSLMI